MQYDRSTELYFETLLENREVHSFLRRHGLTSSGGVPLTKDELEKRLRHIDDQSSRDLFAQSILEKVLGIERPSGRSSTRTLNQDSKQTTEHNSATTIYDNSCGVTMRYCEPKESQKKTSYTFRMQGDEVMVMQHQTSTGSIVVYKSFLAPNDEFTFKSHRLPDSPFTIAIYINGVIDERISTCCEKGYWKQNKIPRKRSLFQLLFIYGGTSCDTCQTNDLMQTASDIEEDWSQVTSAIAAVPEKSSHSISKPPKKKKKKKFDIKPPETQVNEANPSAKETTILNAQVPIENSTEKEKTSSTKIESESALKNKENNDISKIPNQKSTYKSAVKLKPNDPQSKKILNEDEKEKETKPTPTSYEEIPEVKDLLTAYHRLLYPHTDQTSSGTVPKFTLDIPQFTGSSQQTGLSLSLTDRELHAKHAVLSTTSSSAVQPAKFVEPFILIWLDQTIDENEDTINSKNQFRAIVNSLLTYHDLDATIDFIRKVEEVKVFLIISGTLGQKLLTGTKVNELAQLDSIYIFCNIEADHKSLKDQYHKVRGVYTLPGPLCKDLEKDIKQTSNDSLLISAASGMSDAKSSTTDKQHAAFLRAQVHRELLFTMEYPNDARLKLVHFCQKEYRDNDTEQGYIDQLRSDYHTGKAVWWYSRQTFLYKMLNAALRRQDIPMLHKFHFFIKDLHMQLEQLHNLYKPSLGSRTFTVYRGLGMPKNAFRETIQEKVNQLLRFDTFLSTSLKKSVALGFAEGKSNADDLSVLLEIEIDADNLQSPFADISRLSDFGPEDEILFSIGTIFQIDHVASDETYSDIWLVKLSCIDENDERLKAETKQTQLTLLHFFEKTLASQENCGTQQEIAASCTNAATMYFKQGNNKESLNYYTRALNLLSASPSPDPLTIATCQSNIAAVYLASSEQDKALEFYQFALSARSENPKNNDPVLINTLHAIGDIYREKKDYPNALKQYDKALKMQPISAKPPHDHNPSFIAATHINIATVYYTQGQFDKALEHFKNGLTRQKEHLSARHPLLAFLYNNIGAMHYRLKQFQAAYENQLITLEIEEASLPKGHETLVDTYSNIATSCKQLRHFDEAIKYAQKAVEHLKLYNPGNEFDIKKKQKFLDDLKQDEQLH